MGPKINAAYVVLNASTNSHGLMVQEHASTYYRADHEIIVRVEQEMFPTHPASAYLSLSY